MLSGYFMNENRNVYINEIDRISIVRDGKKKNYNWLLATWSPSVPKLKVDNCPDPKVVKK